MPTDNRNLLDVLKFELEFLSKAVTEDCRANPCGHGLFEDSPTCMNFNSKDRGPCSECLLMQFVPENADGTAIVTDMAQLCQYLVAM